MNWYGGNIAEAVAMSKTKNAIFVVYIEGSDELTQKLTTFINEPRIKSKLESEDFVAIKISSNSQAYMQFAKIYQVVPVPSIFFIGNAGTPLEIGTGIIASPDELERKIESVLTQVGKEVGSNSAVNTTATFIASEQAAVEAEATLAPLPTTENNSVIPKIETETNISCDGDTCQSNVKVANIAPVAPSEETAPKQSPTTTPKKEETNANLEETRRLLEQKRRERIEMEKAKELRRRREDEDDKQLQYWQKDQELKELKENLRRERMEEQAARDRIRAQIAGDRAERAKKFAQETTKGISSESTPGPISSPPQVAVSGSTRLQFRLPTGESKSHTFNCQDTLSVVHTFVQTDVIPGTGIRDFIMATSYPKREFSSEHSTQTLLDLGLSPNAVIMVIPKDSGISPARVIARSGGIINMFTVAFWTMLTPVFVIYGYFKSKFGGSAVGGSQKRANEEQQTQTEAPKRRNLERFVSGPSTSQQSPPVNTPKSFGGTENDSHESRSRRRYVGGSNIHRLSDKRKDSDDENATWNGNSTQQQ